MHRLLTYIVTLAMLAAGSSPVAAQGDASLEREAEPPEDNELSGRLDVSHSLAVDDQTARTVSFTDLRLAADAVRLAGLPLGMHVDGRARNSWTDATDDRLTVRERDRQAASSRRRELPQHHPA